MSSCFSFSRSSRRCLRSLRCSWQGSSMSGMALVVGCPGEACMAKWTLQHCCCCCCCMQRSAGAEQGRCSKSMTHGKCSNACFWELVRLKKAGFTFLVSISGIAAGGCSSAGGSIGTGCCTYQVMASVLKTGTCIAPSFVSRVLVSAHRRAQPGSSIWLELHTNMPGRL